MKKHNDLFCLKTKIPPKTYQICYFAILVLKQPSLFFHHLKLIFQKIRFSLKLLVTWLIFWKRLTLVSNRWYLDAKNSATTVSITTLKHNIIQYYNKQMVTLSMVAERCYAVFMLSMMFAGCLYAECRCAECHYTNCCGAKRYDLIALKTCTIIPAIS